MTTQAFLRHRRLRRHSIGALRIVRGVILSVLVGGPIALSWGEEEVLPVYMEPLHRLVLDREPVRVLDVGLEPGDTSLYHLHEDPIFYIALDISEVDAQILGEEWKRTRVAEWQTGAVAHDLGHAEQPTVHRIRNAGSEPFRLIAVTNGGPPSALGDRDGPTALPGTIETDVKWFRQSRVTLAPGSATESFRSEFPFVIVQVSAGRTEVGVGDGAVRALTGPGSFSYVEPGRDFELRNAGDPPVTLIVIETR